MAELLELSTQKAMEDGVKWVMEADRWRELAQALNGQSGREAEDVEGEGREGRDAGEE